jgi:maltose alpha-D-glucosyltransferase/alpha-amylase
MQWTADKNAGFSVASKVVHPVIDEGFFSYKHVNVENQRRDPSSLLNWITAMIRLRKECVEIGWGEWNVLKLKSPHVVAMRYSWKGKSLLIIHNLDERPCELVVSEKDAGSARLIDLINNIESVTDSKKRHTIILDAFGYRWFRAAENN